MLWGRYCCTNISIIGAGESWDMFPGNHRPRISLRFLCVELIGIQNAELQEIIDERTSLSAYYHAENF